MDWDMFLQKVVPAITAIVSIVVLFKQFQIQKKQQDLSEIKHLLVTEEHKLKLYDRRHEVFRALENFLGSVAGSAGVTSDNYDSFITNVFNKRLLFPKDFESYFLEMRDKARSSRTLRELDWHVDGSKLSEKQQAKYDEVFEWFKEKRTNLDNQFGPLLRVG